jgi:2-amino-4-hydroxy-6-hydroxymethyldihydropteridine diphosphokinase
MDKTESNRGRHTALILLGSNVERHYNIPAAIEHLKCHPWLNVVAVSSIYESKAVGGTGEQPVFSNAAVAVQTPLSPQLLRQNLRQIELELGRVRTEDKYAPRPIDLDIVLYDDLIADIDGTMIPDPDIERYAHVAVPIGEIAPDLTHPVSQQTLRTISDRLDRSHLHKLPVT